MLLQKRPRGSFAGISLLYHVTRQGVTGKTLTSMGKKSICCARNILVILLVSMVLQPFLAAAHDAFPPAAPGESSVGIEEHLGKKIPLDLTFRDERGKPVRLGDLVTVPTIILPVYYSCTNICNVLQAGLANALPKVQRSPGTEYRVLSVSFDETETPALAARYKRMYFTAMNSSFPENGWSFLTGDAADIRRLTDASGYRFQRRGRDFIHPVASFVVARDGTIVRYLYGTTFLPKDLTLALLEARDGKVGGTIRKVVGYCFSFDPQGKTYVFNLLRVSATVVLACMGAFFAFLLLSGKKDAGRPSRKP
jgi:protein SCO1